MADAATVKDSKAKTVLKTIFNNKIILAFFLVVLLFIAGEIIVPGFAKFNHVMSVLQAAFFLGLVALGQTIVVVSGKEGLDMSVGAAVTLGVVLGAAIINGNDANLLPAILITLGSGFLLGVVNGVGVSILNLAPLIMTMAWGIVIEGGILFIIKGHMFGTGSPALEFLGHGALHLGSLTVPSVVMIWIVLIVIVLFLMNRTRPGRILYAIGENDRAAELLGIRTRLVRIAIYGISGAVSCLSGLLLLGFVGSAHLNLGARYVLPSCVAVIIGGIRFGGGAGSYLGAVAGCIFLTTLQSILTTLQLSEGGRQTITGLVLIVLLLAYTRGSRRQ